MEIGFVMLGDQKTRNIFHFRLGDLSYNPQLGQYLDLCYQGPGQVK